MDFKAILKIFSCGSNSGNGSVGQWVRMILKVPPQDIMTPQQHPNNTQTTTNSAPPPSTWCITTCIGEITYEQCQTCF